MDKKTPETQPQNRISIGYWKNGNPFSKTPYVSGKKHGAERSWRGCGGIMEPKNRKSITSTAKNTRGYFEIKRGMWLK